MLLKFRSSYFLENLFTIFSKNNRPYALEMNFERKIDSIFSQISYFQQEIKAEHACF